MKVAVADHVDRCLFCNDPVPEGRQVCPICEMKLSQYVDKEVNGIFKKEKEKEGAIDYVLHLNSEQMRSLSAACEFFARITCGQLKELPWHIVQRKSTCDFANKRELAEPLLKELKNIYFPELGWNASYGVGHDDYSDIPWDIYQVIRNKIAWTENPNASCKGVNYYPPLKCSSQPLPTCEVYIDGTKTELPDGSYY